MKKHPFANQLRLRYWYLYRDIQTKSEQLKLKKALSYSYNEIDIEEDLEIVKERLSTMTEI